MPDDLDAGAVAAAVERFNGFYIRLPAVRKLSFTTLSVLHTLAERGALRLGELTATEQVSQPAITQMVTKLEAEGLVERHPDPRDGRAVLVRLTPAGRAIVTARREDRVGRLTPLLDRLDPAERAALAAALPVLEHLAALARLSEGRP
ncbi:MarR family winged helix-turn-helix transcriptional regulator [Actinospica robiniae]|uniref:MarR family winged helix-turn-helix transcriptional regulator n=1 Tax=Actinospica robiniae TaxID=304901 RepID=UPI000401C553|nr:MarR family transcriptional regulator [Actinospica robiniae]